MSEFFTACGVLPGTAHSISLGDDLYHGPWRMLRSLGIKEVVQSGAVGRRQIEGQLCVRNFYTGLRGVFAAATR